MEAYNKRLNKMVIDHAMKIKEEQKNTIVALKKMFFIHFPNLEPTFKNVAYNCRFLAQALEFSDKYEKQINQNFIANIYRCNSQRRYCDFSELLCHVWSK